jgi:uncharacterized protein YigE (DUF2233 family)
VGRFVLVNSKKNVSSYRARLLVCSALAVVTFALRIPAAVSATKSKSRPVVKPSVESAAPPVCREQAFAGKRFEICTFDLTSDDVRLFWKNPQGEPYGSIPEVLNQLAREGKILVFAMAGGMFHSDSTPVGLYKESGKELHALNTEEGVGNFFNKPNGVLYFGKETAGILETSDYIKAKPTAEYAVQAGPLLVNKGALHPKFFAADTVEKPRSGVGVDTKGHLVFAFSKATSNFYSFALLFRDQLDCPNALHLDSTSVSIYVPSLGRLNQWLPIGPILGAARKK